MPQTSPHISKTAHWAALALAVPLFAAGLWLLHAYLSGSFVNEVTPKDAIAVIGFIFVSTGAVYLAMRWAGFLLAQAIGAFKVIGKGNGTSAGSRPSRPK